MGMPRSRHRATVVPGRTPSRRIAHHPDPHRQREPGERPPLVGVRVVLDVAVPDVRHVPLPPPEQHHRHAGREDDDVQRQPSRSEETHATTVRQRTANTSKLATPAIRQYTPNGRSERFAK